MTNFLKKKKILLIITGGIACYKALDLIRRLQEKQVFIECILTESAKKFINIITFESLLGKRVHSNLFSLSKEKEMNHIKLASDMDAILVIPCTANFLAKMANGIADDLALNILLVSKGIKIIAPAMNTNMWSNIAVKKNIKFLSNMGVKIFSPVKGKLACGSKGAGKLMEINEIIDHLDHLFSPKDLTKVKIIITAGASIETIDPVRFLSNFSSGIQGYEIAKSLSSLGANIILISGKTHLEEPDNLNFIQAQSAKDFYNKVISNLPCDVFISAAAISDWKIDKISKEKIKKGEKKNLNLILKKNIDILENIGNHENRPRLIIGFSAETSYLIKNSKSKLKKKNCDWIIANDVSEGQVFGSKYNKVSFISKNKTENWPKMRKSTIAKKISKKIVYFFKENKLEE